MLIDIKAYLTKLDQQGTSDSIKVLLASLEFRASIFHLSRTAVFLFLQLNSKYFQIVF
jgi:hypothetical protein